MAEAKIQKRNTYTIYDDEGIGTVQIADEVVAIIAGLAATEVDGVASMAGNITNELVSKLGIKIFPRVSKLMYSTALSAWILPSISNMDTRFRQPAKTYRKK